MNSSTNDPATRQFRKAWVIELRRAALIALLGLLAGWLFQAPRTGLIIAMLCVFAWHLRQLWLLAWWLMRDKYRSLPDPGGVWGEVFDELYASQRRNRKRKRKLASIVSEFQASTAALPDGAVVLSAEGRIAWFNDAAQHLLGLRSPQDIGNRVNNFIRSPVFHRYFESTEYERDVEVESPLGRQLTLSLRLIPYGDQQRLLIVRDISEHKRLDRMRRDFVANASHELRTPLTVLSGYMEMMQPEAEKPGGPLAPWKAPLTEMRDQLARMELLINDLLKLARLEGEGAAPRGENVDVADIIRECVKQAQQLSRDRHRFTLDIDDELMLGGRATELHSIVMNLLSNAVRYTPGEGTINVSWQRIDDGGARLAVSDNGIGIEPDVIPRLTERFYRVDIGRSRASGGTGLGLAIVKHALELHEGRLRVESTPGEGSTFICEFPPRRLRSGDEGERRAS